MCLVPNHFFLHSGLSAFSFLEQSSILPPPWLPANVGIDKTIKADTEAMYRWMRDTIEANRHKLPEEDRDFDIRFMTLTMFNIMFVYYDLVDEDKISADDYRTMLVNQIRNSARNTVSS